MSCGIDVELVDPYRLCSTVVRLACHCVKLLQGLSHLLSHSLVFFNAQLSGRVLLNFFVAPEDMKIGQGLIKRAISLFVWVSV